MSYRIEYRPKVLDEVVGNKPVRRSLQVLLKNPKKLPHAWLFTGISGVGKTTLARIIASRLGAKAPGIIEVNAADTRGIDDIRDLSNRARFQIPGSPISVYIFDECHQWTVPAQNALLKVLEDAPRCAYFILATTDPQKLIPTIRTRCTEFHLRPVPPEEIAVLLHRVAEKEGLKEISDEVLVKISMRCSGSPRMALNMLERCVAGGALEDLEPLLEMVQLGGTDGELDVSGAITNILVTRKYHGKPELAWGKIKDVLAEAVRQGEDLGPVKQGLINRIGKMLLSGTVPFEVINVMIEISGNMFSNAANIAAIYKLCFAFLDR